VSAHSDYYPPPPHLQVRVPGRMGWRVAGVGAAMDIVGCGSSRGTEREPRNHRSEWWRSLRLDSGWLFLQVCAANKSHRMKLSGNVGACRGFDDLDVPRLTQAAKPSSVSVRSADHDSVSM
jgi:hypothetical protein